MPRSVLMDTLSALDGGEDSSSLSGASATRRSAGIPVLVLKVAAGEPKGVRGRGGGDSLLEAAVEK